MKRVFNYTVIVFFALCFFFSCRKETDFSTKEDAVIYFPCEPENNSNSLIRDTLEIAVSGSWRAYSSAVWCTLSPEKGKGRFSKPVQLVISCQVNESTEDRHCFITLEGDGSKKSIEVFQKANALIVGPDTLQKIGNCGGEINVGIRTNAVDVNDLTIDIPADIKWLKYKNDLTKAQLFHVITFQADANDNYETRKASVALTYDGKVDTVYFEQAEKYGLILSSKDTTFNIGNKGGTVSVPLKTNVKESLKIDCSGNWVSCKWDGTKAMSDCSVQLTIEKNNTVDTRTATVTLSYNNSVMATVYISQKGIPSIKAETREYSCNSTETKEIDVVIGHNVPYDVKIPSDATWVNLEKKPDTVQPVQLTKDTLKFTIAKNSVATERKADIILENTEENLSDTITFRQVVPDGLYEDLSAGETANCYIVNKAGAYKFKLAKGNSAEYFGVTKSVSVLWESLGTSSAVSERDLISSVKLSNGYVYFTTVAKFVEGNALMAAYDAGGKILWSWHIWLCGGYNPESTAQGYVGGTIMMMDRNLGAVSATPGDVKALGLLYQWGRKDPFLSSGTVSGTAQAKSTYTWPQQAVSSSVTGTTDYTIANPAVFITSTGGTFDWRYTTTIDNTRWTEPGQNKSVYDPCPPGWRVPSGGNDGVWATELQFVNDSVITSAWDASKYGYSLSLSVNSAKAWYPAAGGKSYNSGNIANVGSEGVWWSATPSSDNKIYVLRCHDGGSVNTAYESYRAEGHSVRCVSESSQTIIGVKQITLNKTALTINVDKEVRITPTILPSNATVKSLVWSSSNEDVAKIDQTGKVTAMAIGKTTITVKAANGCQAICYVTVVDLSHASEDVDLGLSVTWAKCNIGALSEEEAGASFAWGETIPKDEYTQKNYDSALSIKYTEAGSVLEMADDAANQNWGGYWRMPTKEEWTELVNNCTWTSTSVGGVSGYRVASKSNASQSIFISSRTLWSSSLYSSSQAVSFLPSSPQTFPKLYRYYGWSVRPVKPVMPTGLSLTKNVVTISVGVQKSLKDYVRILPDRCKMPLSWESQNNSVATVSSDGVVTGVAEGSAGIRVKCGNYEKAFTVDVTACKYESVDLGLSVNWATTNIGAVTNEDKGAFFAWGETKSKLVYDWNTYAFYSGLTKYNASDKKQILDKDDDAAYVNCPGEWRTPTEDEWIELLQKCNWVWQKSPAGYNVTSRVSGYSSNSIFLPAVDSGYWSATLYGSDIKNAVCFYFNQSGSRNTGNRVRMAGCTVRPVMDVPASSVSIVQSNVEIPVGGAATLTANVEPSRCKMPVTWKSDDSSIAAVTADGVVVGKSLGKTTVTAECGMYKSSCTVDVVAQMYEYVDFGLSVKWARCNIGAKEPYEAGNFYAWGETSPKALYNWTTYKWGNAENGPCTKYVKSGSAKYDYTELQLDDDAARASWGGSWRIPSDNEWNELLQNCNKRYEANYMNKGVAGWVFTRPSYTADSLFVPKTGQYQSDIRLEKSSAGHYWTNQLGASYYMHAYELNFRYDGEPNVAGDVLRCYGSAIRPVCP